MTEQKFIQLQHQIKHNNVELQDFLKDLDSWEKDVKQKDEKLKTEKVDEKEVLPPVRNSLEKKKKKKKKKPPKVITEEKQNGQVKKRIKGYDYRSWDKFDVDKACEDVDNASDSTPSEYETDEEWEVERMKLLAVQHKDQGNDYFKKGNYIEAIECYTRGIECDPDNAVLLANRAMALLKQDKYAAAELDCTKSLMIDSGYLKAYHRRGQARAALKKYTEAKEDFLQVLKVEPQNKQAKAELENVERILNPPKLLQSKALDASDAGIVKAIYKAPNKRSKKPLKRIVIEEINADEEGEKRRQTMLSAQQSQSDTKKSITAKDNELFEKLVKDNSDNQDKEQSAKDNVPSITDITDSNESKKDGSHSKSSANVDSSSQESSSVAHNSEALKLNLDSDTVIESSHTGDSKSSEHASCNGGLGSCGSSPSTSPRIPPVPTSSYQFQADWKSLRHTAEPFYQYFKEIEPSKYSKLFGQFLDSDVLVKIFQMLKECYIRDGVDAYPVLKHLCDVKRFSMTVMFMSSKDKQVLREVFSHLKTQQKHPSQDVDKLQTKYEL